MPATATAPALYDVVMLSFDGVNRASQVLHMLKAEKALDGCEIEGEAVVSRDESGQVHLHERGAFGVGATFGAVTAGVIGFVGGPVLLLLMVVAGGVAGGIAGHFAGQILPHDELQSVGESLPPGTSAYLALVDAAHAECIADAFAAEGARVITIPVETDVSNVIREAITHRVRRA
jgi:uncharacterized membrane protein